MREMAKDSGFNMERIGRKIKKNCETADEARRYFYEIFLSSLAKPQSRLSQIEIIARDPVLVANLLAEAEIN